MNISLGCADLDHDKVENRNWQKAGHLTIYKCGLGVDHELGSAVKHSSYSGH